MNQHNTVLPTDLHPWLIALKAAQRSGNASMECYLSFRCQSLIMTTSLGILEVAVQHLESTMLGQGWLTQKSDRKFLDELLGCLCAMLRKVNQHG